MAGASSAGSDYFNDLRQQPPSGFPSSRSHHQPEQQPEAGQATGNNNEEENGQVPRPKRIACVVCRKRKLRCDGKKPSCGTCSRLGHDCAYDEVRRKSGPKRGYVKQLEARLAQVETLLKTQEPSEPNRTPTTEAPSLNNPQNPTNQPNPQPNAPFHPAPDLSMFTDNMEDVTSLPLNDPFGNSQATMPPLDDPTFGISDEFSWEMIGLGLEEPLPNQDVIDELHQIYFERIHPSVPIIHRPRYLAAMNLAPSMRPPVCLRYIIWCHSACVTDKYASLQKLFYQRARKYMEMDTMKGQGEGIVSVAHAQCWILLGAYEFKHMSFPRAWMSSGSSARIAIMMGLHRQDGLTTDVKQSIPSPRDWTEREERRRTFWMAFCQDRYASIGTGWPMAIDEKDIYTNLPASEEAFLNGTPQETLPLSDVMAGQGASTLSSFGGIVLMACLFGRNLTHLHRPESNDNDHDLNGEFWKRHRALDNLLLNTSLSLPEHLRLPFGVEDPNTVFLNMNIHTSTICLHQAAIFKADRHRLPAQLVTDSKRRCLAAANQITNTMKMISHADLTATNPFTAFCLYVGARVFIQYLKSHPNDGPVISSLRFLLSAMNALKTKNPLTESFLTQLDVDLEGSGLEEPRNVSKFSYGLQKGVQEIPPDDDPDDYHSAVKNSMLQTKFGETAGLNKCGGLSNGDGGENIPILFPCHSSLPSRPKPDTGPCASYEGPSPMTLPGVMPPASGCSGERDNEFLVPNMMDTGGSSGVSTNSDRQQLPSDQATPSTQRSSVNNSFTPPDEPSPNKQQQQEQQQQGQTRQPQQSQYDILSADIYPTPAPNTSGTGQPPTIPPCSPFFPVVSGADSFAPTLSESQERPSEPFGRANPFAMHAAWQLSTANSDTVSQGGNMNQTTLGSGPGGGGGGTGMGMDPGGEGNWDQILSSMGWNEWQQQSPG